MQKKFAAAKRATMTNARQQTQGSKPARFIELTCGPNMPSTITASAMTNRTVCSKRRVDRARRKGPRRGRDNKSKWPVGIAEVVFGGNNFHRVRETVETVAEVRTVPVTPLKPGVNETERSETLSSRKTRAKREFRTGSEGTSTLSFDCTVCGRTSRWFDERY